MKSKNVYIDKLDDIVNENNNSYHRTIKMKPIDVRTSTYLDFEIGSDKEDRKLEIDYLVRIPKYKNIFAKCYTPNLSEEGFVIKKVKNTVPWSYVT